MKNSVVDAIQNLVLERNYPCIAAVQALVKDDYRVGAYRHFGSAECAAELARDLLAFREDYQKGGSPFLSFFAVFEGAGDFSEEEFEVRLWQELSGLSAVEGLSKKWDPHFSENPEDKNFCFSLDGTAFFVVGMHANSSRKARRLSRPVLVFNIYEQFRDLQKAGKYQAMVQLNRKRDLAYQGSVNPMALAHGDEWEAIQFSGRNNSQEWKCPFHHGAKKSPQNS